MCESPTLQRYQAVNLANFQYWLVGATGTGIIFDKEEEGDRRRQRASQGNSLDHLPDIQALLTWMLFDCWQFFF